MSETGKKSKEKKKKKGRLSAEELELLIARLSEMYPNAKAELDFKNPFELLIATMLSAQCTDVRVNKTTPELFAKLGKASDIYHLAHEELERIIKPCGLYKSKAKNIRLTCETLDSKYGGEVPQEIETLVSFPGVGRKTANVVVSNAYGIPAIAVDTHVKRVSNRIGLVRSEKVEEVERELMRILPKNLWTIMHHLLIFHGRRVCKAIKPNCEGCGIKDLCRHQSARD